MMHSLTEPWPFAPRGSNHPRCLARRNSPVALAGLADVGQATVMSMNKKIRKRSKKAPFMTPILPFICIAET